MGKIKTKTTLWEKLNIIIITLNLQTGKKNRQTKRLDEARIVV